MNPLLLLFLFVYMTSQQRVDEANYYAAYMIAMVKEQTVSACEGEILSIRCPSMTTISILAATYGRREEKCQTTTQGGEDDVTDDNDVTNKCKQQKSTTTSLKSPRSAASECDEKRFCEIVVKKNDDEEECGNFTYLYLQVKYKCRIVTDELKRKVSCSGDSIKLRCPQRIPDTNYFLYVYDVTHAYNSECQTNYPSTMSYCNETEMGMMKLISNECFNKTRCSIHVPRDLCNNSIQISYLCLPQQILTRRKPHQIYKFLQLQKQTTTNPPTSTITTKSSPTTTQGNHHDLTPPLSDVTTAIVTSPSPSKTPAVATSPSSPAVTSSTGSNSTATSTLLAETISTTVKLRGERGANQSSMTSSSNVTSQTSLSSHPLHFITSMITLMEFVQEHSDRILMIIFAITSIFLFFVCIFLMCHYERPCSGANNSSKKQQQNSTNNKSHNPSVTSQQQQQHDDHESTSLLGGPNDNVQVHSTATDGGASKRMAHMWRTHLLSGAWCASCCKTPWQRRRDGRQQAVVATDADNCYRVVNHRRASSISDDEDDDVDDDVISAVVRSPSSNNSHHPGMMLMTLEGSGGKDETRYGAFPVNRYDDDATSLYEFPDQPNTALQPTTGGGGGSNGLYVGSGHAGHVYATTRDRSPMVVASNNTSPRGDPPPFPKPSRYEQQQQDLKKKLPIIQQPPLRTSTAKFPYHCHHHHHHHPHHGGSTAIVPHYATQRNNTGAQQYRYAQNVMLRHLPTRQGAFPSTFTTQPYHHQHQQRHESTTFVALRHQLTTSSSSPVSGGQQQQQQVQQERRGSFYDNSLPRDSPLYEYYQSELPGTRNLNQYFS